MLCQLRHKPCRNHCCGSQLQCVQPNSSEEYSSTCDITLRTACTSAASPNCSATHVQYHHHSPTLDRSFRQPSCCKSCHAKRRTSQNTVPLQQKATTTTAQPTPQSDLGALYRVITLVGTADWQCSVACSKDVPWIAGEPKPA